MGACNANPAQVDDDKPAKPKQGNSFSDLEPTPSNVADARMQAPAHRETHSLPGHSTHESISHSTSIPIEGRSTISEYITDPGQQASPRKNLQCGQSGYLFNKDDEEYPVYEGTAAKALSPWEANLQKPKWELSELFAGKGDIGFIKFGGFNRCVMLLEQNELQILKNSKGTPTFTLPLEDAKLARKASEEADGTWILYMKCPRYEDPEELFEFKFGNQVDVSVWYRKLIMSIFMSEGCQLFQCSLCRPGKEYDPETYDVELNELIPSGPHSWLKTSPFWMKEDDLFRCNSEGSNLATYLVDGCDQTYWQPSFEWTPNAWCVFDLRAPHAVSKFQYLTEDEKEAPRNCKLFCSDVHRDPEVEEGWSLCAEWSGLQKKGWQGTGPHGSQASFINGVRTARYWRLWIDSTQEGDGNAWTKPDGPKIYGVKFRGIDVTESQIAENEQNDLKGSRSMMISKSSSVERRDAELHAEFSATIQAMGDAGISMRRGGGGGMGHDLLPPMRPHKEFVLADLDLEEDQGQPYHACVCVEQSQRALERVLQASGDHHVVVQTSLELRHKLAHAAQVVFWEKQLECCFTTSLDGKLAQTLPAQDLCVVVSSTKDDMVETMMPHLVQWSKDNPLKNCTMLFVPGVTQEVADFFTQKDSAWKSRRARYHFATLGQLPQDNYGPKPDDTAGVMFRGGTLRCVGIRGANVGVKWEVLEPDGIPLHKAKELNSKVIGLLPKGSVLTVDPKETDEEFCGCVRVKVLGQTAARTGWANMKAGGRVLAKQADEVSIEPVPTESMSALLACVPMEPDLYSFEDKQFLRSIILQHADHPLTWLSQAIFEMEHRVFNCKFRLIQSKGKIASEVFRKLLDLNNSDRGQALMSSGRLVIFDRMVDLAASTRVAKTYGGLMKELFKSNDAARKVALHEIDVTTAEGQLEHYTVKRALSFDSEDTIWEAIGQLPFLEAMDYLKTLGNKYNEFFGQQGLERLNQIRGNARDGIRVLHDFKEELETYDDLASFVKAHIHIQAEMKKRWLEEHTSILGHRFFVEINGGMSLRRMADTEALAYEGILDRQQTRRKGTVGRGSDELNELAEELCEKKIDIRLLLRFLITTSNCTDGLASMRQGGSLHKKVEQNYNKEAALMLERLAMMELIRGTSNKDQHEHQEAMEVLQYPGTDDPHQKAMDTNSDPPPFLLLPKLVEEWNTPHGQKCLNGYEVNKGWAAGKDVRSCLGSEKFGPTLEDDLGGGDDINDFTVVLFVGGCTYDEYSAIKALGRKKGKKFTVITTGIINANSMASMFLK